MRCYTQKQCRYGLTYLLLENLKYSQLSLHHHKMAFTVMSNRGKPDDQVSVVKMKGCFLDSDSKVCH